MSQIQVVLFDVGNVILRATHEITYAILADLGVRPDKLTLFFHANAGAYYGEFSRGKISGAQFAQAVREVLEAPYLTDEQIRVAHDAHIYMVDQAVVVVLEELKVKGVRLGFVTDTNFWQTERERELVDLAAQFGMVVRSHEIGMTKTDDGAWATIFIRLGLEIGHASSILLIDDAYANCEAACRLGLQVHQYGLSSVEGVLRLRADLLHRRLLG